MTAYASSDDNGLKIDSKKHELIQGFTNYRVKGHIHLSASNSFHFALVFDKTNLVVCKQNHTPSFDEYTLEKTVPQSCTFTSLIAGGDDFYLSLSDGRILHCFKTSDNRYGFALSSPNRSIAGFHSSKEHKTSTPSILLGANTEWLAYQSSKNYLIFLRRLDYATNKLKSLHAFEQYVEDPIVGFAFCSDTNLLWIVTAADAGFCLHKIDPNRRTKKHFMINLGKFGRLKPSLLSVSSQGDVAFEAFGEFVIFQPWRSNKAPRSTYIGESADNNHGGQGCFASVQDTQYFFFCGEKYPEIAVAAKMGTDWVNAWCYPSRELGKMTDFQLAGSMHWDSLLTHPEIDGQGRLIVRVKSKSSMRAGRVVSAGY
tara:strand:+ start:2300 stop:3409 length:1110 start_codon:yes stop_codon:yes gene_type:complete